MMRGLKNGFLRGDREEQRGSREVRKSRRTGHQGKCGENPKSVKECNTRSPSALCTVRPCSTRMRQKELQEKQGHWKAVGKCHVVEGRTKQGSGAQERP